MSVLSWDSYIDNLIAQTQDASGTAHADRACIIGLVDGASWTTPKHPRALKLQGSEGPNIANCFKSNDFTPLMTRGVYAEGAKYQFQFEEFQKIVFAKKKDEGALTMQVSKTAIVIAHTRKGGQQGNTNKGVAIIANHLESKGV